jgi:tetratricopeptide (TPR) repeat protein
MRNAERALEADPRNLRAAFGLAALYAREKRFTPAMTILRKTLDLDPAWDRDHLVPTDFPTSPADLVPFADVFAAAVLKAGEESLTSLRLSAEATIRFHAGQREAATALLRKALQTDPQNHAAVLHLSVLELERGDVTDPRNRLRDFITQTTSTHPITLLYLARADASAGELDLARKRLVDLIDAEPNLVQARYTLAMVLREQQLDARAREELQAAVQQDPDFLPAKRALDDKR